MRGRQPQETKLCDLKVVSTPLPFPDAQAILPEVATIVALGLKEIGEGMGSVKGEDDVMKLLLPVLLPITRHFGDGYLMRLAPKILACTEVWMPDVKGGLLRQELMKEKDRNDLFNDYPELFLPVLFYAGQVTFKRFFPESVLTALAELRKAAAERAASILRGSSRSTSSTPTPTG